MCRVRNRISRRSSQNSSNIKTEPGTLPILGPGEASELADNHVDLETLWGASAAELRERLCLATAPMERFGLLENALASHLFRAMECHRAVQFALHFFEEPGRTATIEAAAPPPRRPVPKWLEAKEDEPPQARPIKTCRDPIL